MVFEYIIPSKCACIIYLYIVKLGKTNVTKYFTHVLNRNRNKIDSR